MQLTYKQYDEMVDMLTAIPNKTPDWLPTRQEFEEVVEWERHRSKIDPMFIEFLIWLSETSSEPQTDEGIEVKKLINKFLIDNIVLED